MHRHLLVAAFMLLPCLPSHAQAECDGRQIFARSPCAGDEVDATERQLAELINAYRAENGLAAIPISPALSRVANRHVRDLALNLKQLTHDWSNCPTSRSWDCMWNAPQTLGTGYPGSGYENAFGALDAVITPAEILDSWKERGEARRPHNDVILNRAGWKPYTWRALGVGIYRGFAVMWVGAEEDPTR